MWGIYVEYDQQVLIRLDKRTKAFLDALKYDENVNVSAWIRDAIREKAGLKTEKPKKRQ